MTRGKVQNSPKATKKRSVKKAQTVTGTKRKKKDDVFANDTVKTASETSAGRDSKSSVPDSLPDHSNPTIPHYNSLLHSDRCSSTSSMEISKPQRKLGRYECSSSDAMSVDNTSTTMDCGGSSSQSTANHSLSSLNPSAVPLYHSQSAATHTLGVNHVPSASSTLSNLTDVTSATCSASVSTDSRISGPSYTSETLSMPCSDISKESLYSPTDDPIRRQQPNHLTSHSELTTESTDDSLRWTNVCSDEDKELKRIELYKENRRKRYEDALKQRRTQQSQPAGSVYYTSDDP